MKLGVEIVIGIFLTMSPLAVGQEVIRLYSGVAPGSEHWTHEEKEYFSPIYNTQVVTNVSQPTLTRYAPAPETANGTAVIICPGGGFHSLSINSEGVDVAKWLTAKGVTAFVLKYRLVPTGEDGVRELHGKKREKIDEDMRSVFKLATADDSVDLYSKWLAAKKSAELHMYSKGGHGFGMRKQKLPSDQWIERFGDWLDAQGLLKK